MHVVWFHVIWNLITRLLKWRVKNTTRSQRQTLQDFSQQLVCSQFFSLVLWLCSHVQSFVLLILRLYWIFIFRIQKASSGDLYISIQFVICLCVPAEQGSPYDWWCVLYSVCVCVCVCVWRTLYKWNLPVQKADSPSALCPPQSILIM